MTRQVFRFKTKLATPPRSRRIMRCEIVSTFSTGYLFSIHFYHQINFEFESEMPLQSTMYHQNKPVHF